MRLDLWIIGLYMLGTLVIGWRVSDKSRDVEGYTVGGRDMPGWIVGLSVLGAFLSSITFLALPADTYKKGNWSGFIFGVTAPIAALIAVTWLVPLYRRRTRLSAYQLLESRFGYWARAYAALSFVGLQMLRVGMVQLLVGMSVEPMLRLDHPPDNWFSQEPTAAEWASMKIIGLIVLSGLIVIVYDVMGGIRAVIWTDTVQVGVLSVGALWILGELTVGRPGGMAGFVRDLPAERMELGQWLNVSESGVWDWAIGSVLLMAIYGISENLRNYGADQQYVQRMLAARDERNAKRAIWIGALGYQPLNLIFCLIGTALWLHVQDLNAAGPDHHMAGLAAERILPTFIHREVPDVVAGLVIAAILAAAMSTTDSSMNSSSMVIHFDLVKRLVPGPPRVREILALRLWTIAVGMLGTEMAVIIYLKFGRDHAEPLMRVWWQYAGIAGGGMFGLFLLAWTMPRLPAWVAAAGVLASIPVMAWGTLARDLPMDSAWYEYQCTLHPTLVGVMGTAAVVAVGLAGYLAVKLRLTRSAIT